MPAHDGQYSNLTGVLWQIYAPHYTAGPVVTDGIVTEAAPILRWAVGRRWTEVRAYLAAKGYHGTPLPAE